MVSTNKIHWAHLAREYVVSVFPSFMIIDTLTQGIKKTAGRNIKFAAQSFKDNAVAYYYDPQDWQESHILFVAKIKKNSLFLEEIIKRTILLSSQLVIMAKTLAKRKLSQLPSNKVDAERGIVRKIN